MDASVAPADPALSSSTTCAVFSKLSDNCRIHPLRHLEA
jgi:hypothetical protein